MGKRGVSPKGKIKILWSPNFAYAIGLLASDGCVGKNGRHLNLTSKDKEMVTNFLKGLNIDCHIGKKNSGSVKEKKYFVVQIGDVLFCKFLMKIGIMPAKSKIIGKVDVPGEYFFDFARGLFDGDGSTYSYFDPRWPSSFMFYLSFASASKKHIDWLRREFWHRLKIKGHVTQNGSLRMFQLKYAKRESLIIIKKMYHFPSALSLTRKRLKIQKMLGIVGEKLYN